MYQSKRRQASVGIADAWSNIFEGWLKFLFQFPGFGVG
jgi:hypothetical protein